jgi:hypothetical protein
MHTGIYRRKGNEDTMKKYIYHDNSKNGEVVFSCYADDILEADKKYEKQMKKKVAKQSFIGCEIKNENNRNNRN